MPSWELSSGLSGRTAPGWVCGVSAGGAGSAGVQVRMSASAACALAPNLLLAPRDEAAEAASLEGLAAWAGQFTSFVRLASPHGLLLEIGGSLALFGGLDVLLARVRHGIDALQRLDSADQHGTGSPGRLSYGVQAVPRVDRLHVGVSWRSEHRRVLARTATLSRVGRIARRHISFHLDKPTGCDLASVASYQRRSQQFAGDDDRIAVIEVSTQSPRHGCASAASK